MTRLDDSNHEFKWNKLNNTEYLSHISGDRFRDVSSRSWEAFINCFTRNLQIAQEEHCEPSDRWIHLMICSRYLMSARDSREYRQFYALFKHPQDLYIIDTGFTLHHYITELEIVSGHLVSYWPILTVYSCYLVFLPSWIRNTSTLMPFKQDPRYNLLLLRSRRRCKYPRLRI